MIKSDIVPSAFTCVMNSPLLEQDGLPAFTHITADVVEPAIDTILQENREQLEALLAQPGPFT